MHDFAGGGPVHLLGGMNSFVGVIFLGPRKGRFDKNRREADYSESSPTNQLLGLLVLWFAWIGFNCGSSFGITEDKWLVATRTAVSTMNASMGGGLMGIKYIPNGQQTVNLYGIRPYEWNPRWSHIFISNQCVYSTLGGNHYWSHWFTHSLLDQ